MTRRLLLVALACACALVWTLDALRHPADVAQAAAMVGLCAVAVGAAGRLK